MLATKLSCANTHITPTEISNFLKVPVKSVCDQEVKLIAFHKCRLLKKTPFEYITYFVHLIDRLVSPLGETKELLISETLIYSYTILGLDTARRTALISL